jgi:hypothetical protein
VNIKNLGRLEALIWQLESPKWEDTKLPSIDTNLAETGAELYEKNCSGCHATIQRDDPDRRVTARLLPLNLMGTDKFMAENFKNRMIENSRLDGLYKNYWRIASKGKKFEDPMLNAEALKYTVTGVITRNLFDNAIETIRAIRAGRPSKTGEIIDDVEKDLKALENASLREKKKLIRKFVSNLREDSEQGAGECHPVKNPCYKARPLNGIWSTAPYLHNGSVPSLYAMLSPASERPPAFCVGSRAFDPEHVGFKFETPVNGICADGTTLLDTTKPGNSNAGHEFKNATNAGNGVIGKKQFTKDERLALIEYLKSL